MHWTGYEAKIVLTAPSSFLIRMHPNIDRDLPLLRELDHVHGRRVSPFLARSAFQRRLKFPDRRIARTTDRIERNAGAGLTSMALDLRPVTQAAGLLQVADSVDRCSFVRQTSKPAVPAPTVMQLRCAGLVAVAILSHRYRTATVHSKRPPGFVRRLGSSKPLSAR
jgi:hypothetical protein